MKKFIILLLSVAMIATFSFPAYATSSKTDKVQPIEQYQVSEYDYITELQSKSSSELLACGYSAEDISYIRNFSLDTALLERARLSDSELIGRGYTSEQIALLRAYENGASLDSNQLRNALATFSGSLVFNAPEEGYPRTTRMSISFIWNWSNLPLYIKDDIVACGFAGVNTSNMACSMKPVQSNTSCTIRYYGFDGQAMYTTYPSVQYPIFNSFVRCSFPMIMHDGISENWAKGGTFKVTIEEVVRADQLTCGVFAFGYGHKVIVNDSVSVGISIDGNGTVAGSVSLTFSEGLDPMYYKNILYYSNGQHEIFNGI